MILTAMFLKYIGRYVTVQEFDEKFLSCKIEWRKLFLVITENTIIHVCVEKTSSEKTNLFRK